MLLPQVSAQHQRRCSISSLAVGPPLLRTGRAGDELWLFHSLGFPSGSTPTSTASWGDPAGSPTPFLPCSLVPHLGQPPARPSLSWCPAPQRRQGVRAQGRHWGDASLVLPSSPRLPWPPQWDGCCRPPRVAQAPVRGDNTHAGSLLRQRSAGNPSLLRCMAGDPLRREAPTSGLARAEL